MTAIPSPDLLVNLFASGAQVLGLLAVALGGTWFAKGRLGREETAQFVRAQIAAASVSPESVFAPETYDAVFDATDGVARLVNQVCA